MTRGKRICKILKEIRQQIADKNEIEYVTTECHFKGECKGTCPKCESEVRYLENELDKRRQLGKAVAIAGISIGVISSFSACNSSSQKGYNTTKSDDTSDSTSFISEAVLGDVYDEKTNTLNTAKEALNVCNIMTGETPILKVDWEPLDEIETYTEGIIIPKELIHENNDDSFLIAEIEPEYPGGEKELLRFLANHITYPKAAKENKIEGRVFITFVVEKDGSISNSKILRDIGYGCGEEALRVVKAMSKWKPAEQRGQSVRTEMNIPVTFSLNK